MRKIVEFVNNGMINVPNIKLEYRGYYIVPKRDMGSSAWLVNANLIRKGYVVTDDGIINVMPGATWFKSVVEAKVAIDILFEANDDSQKFWELLREKQGLSEYEEV